MASRPTSVALNPLAPQSPSLPRMRGGNRDLAAPENVPSIMCAQKPLACTAEACPSMDAGGLERTSCGAAAGSRLARGREALAEAVTFVTGSGSYGEKRMPPPTDDNPLVLPSLANAPNEPKGSVPRHNVGDGTRANLEKCFCEEFGWTRGEISGSSGPRD